MKFEDALKLLAEKRGENFRICEDEGQEFFDWAPLGGSWKTVPLGFATQDDLDEIAALLGWEYFVAAEFMLDVPTGESVFLGWQGYIFQKRQPPEDPTTDVFPTKLDAAKAALVAIILETTK